MMLRGAMQRAGRQGAVAVARRARADLLAQPRPGSAGVMGMQRRGMAGHGALHVNQTHKFWGEFFMTVMFTWMGIRFYHDGKVLLVGTFPFRVS
jgi:hypothetical protein